MLDVQPVAGCVGGISRVQGGEEDAPASVAEEEGPPGRSWLLVLSDQELAEQLETVDGVVGRFPRMLLME